MVDLKVLSSHLGPLFCTRRNGLYRAQWKHTLIPSLSNLKGFNCRAVNHNAKKHRQIDQIRYETAQTQSSTCQADCRAKIEMNAAHNYSILHFHCTFHPERSPSAHTCAWMCVQRQDVGKIHLLVKDTKKLCSSNNSLYWTKAFINTHTTS